MSISTTQASPLVDNVTPKLRRWRSLAAIGLLLAAILAADPIVAATPAEAWATSSRVDLKGRANCQSPTDRVTRVELWARRMDTGRETYHVAALDSGRYAREYRVRLDVPRAGSSVWVRVTCRTGGAYWTGGPGKLEVKRPSTGYGATRHLCPPRNLQACR